LQQKPIGIPHKVFSNRKPQTWGDFKNRLLFLYLLAKTEQMKHRKHSIRRVIVNTLKKWRTNLMRWAPEERKFIVSH
jgi:hypothetical protein